MAISLKMLIPHPRLTKGLNDVPTDSIQSINFAEIHKQDKNGVNTYEPRGRLDGGRGVVQRKRVSSNKSPGGIQSEVTLVMQKLSPHGQG